MRLWHENLIPLLPRQQLLGQHREAAALRGNGWKRPHRTVDYVFNYPMLHLVAYHFLVMEEMERRGYRVDPKWKQAGYRGLRCEPMTYSNEELQQCHSMKSPIYREHNDKYLQECVENLKQKGIEISL